MSADIIGKTGTEANDDSKDLLPIFWDLASINEEKRVKRVVDLISILKGKEDDTNEKVYTTPLFAIFDIYLAIERAPLQH